MCIRDSNITLSVVIAADGLLHRPDISAEEKSLQLFLQLAGRAGRAQKVGKVIFQTYKPSHPVISYLKNRDYERFLIENSKLRKEAKLFPPAILIKAGLIKNFEHTNAATGFPGKQKINFFPKIPAPIGFPGFMANCQTKLSAPICFSALCV